MSAAQTADIALAFLPNPNSCGTTPYTVTTNARRPGEYILSFGVVPSLVHTDEQARLAHSARARTRQPRLPRAGSPRLVMTTLAVGFVR